MSGGFLGGLVGGLANIATFGAYSSNKQSKAQQQAAAVQAAAQQQANRLQEQANTRAEQENNRAAKRTVNSIYEKKDRGNTSDLTGGLAGETFMNKASLGSGGNMGSTSDTDDWY